MALIPDYVLQEIKDASRERIETNLELMKSEAALNSLRERFLFTRLIHGDEDPAAGADEDVRVYKEEWTRELSAELDRRDLASLGE